MKGRGDSAAAAQRFRQQVHGSAEQEQLEALSNDVDLTIDARGTYCPEPVIRTQNGVRDLGAGQIAMLLADDRGVELDIPAWCMSTGNEYLGLKREATFYRVFVRKS